MIAESMDCFGVRLAPSRRTAFALRRVEATAVSASPEESTTVTDALSAKARKPTPGLEGVKVLPSGPWFAAKVSMAPLLPDAAYMGLVLPMPGVMSAGRLVDDDDALLLGTADDDDGLDGNSRVAICVSVH